MKYWYVVFLSQIFQQLFLLTTESPETAQCNDRQHKGVIIIYWKGVGYNFSEGGGVSHKMDPLMEGMKNGPCDDE